MRKSEDPNPENLDSTNSENSPVPRNGGPTGPRTSQGKGRSKLNATTHGILSRVAVLKHESPDEYASLLKGLRDACGPEGALEDILVEKLATTLWRYRRLITAETGEIDENLNSNMRIDVRMKEQERLNSEYLDRVLRGKGVIGMMYEVAILETCIASLEKLRESIRTKGFRKGLDHYALAEVYGYRNPNYNPDIGAASGTRNKQNLLDTYDAWRLTAEATEEERQKYGYASPSQCREQVLEAIKNETDRLKGMLDDLKVSKAEQSELEKSRRSLPEPDRMERLLRYEASLERTFDRTLVQLERLQRMRLGQAVTPPLTINVAQ